MGSDDWTRIKSLFAGASELPADARDAYLQDGCGGDAALRGEVEALLRAADRIATATARPPLPTGLAHGLGPTAAARQPSPETAGATIGLYKLLQRIGEGGMGTVWLAEQRHPVARQVALKVVKLGMDTRQVIARFEAERQALAIMDHPNIARVIDAGATDTGRPYFVMELVRGVPITEYCDRHQLTVRQRVELLIPVCQAIQHAHQKGIIHRDLKPSNVLVALHDGNPVPKVIDFGIAKATNARLTERTMFTEQGQMIGTPAYMSPEQAEVSGLDVDTRSDIYSLGVLTYELLTGVTPFDAARLRGAAYGEMQRIIREVEPPRPSTRLSTLDTLPSVAARRRIEPTKLTKLIRGELDWIVMCCLEKDRTRRYETASALANDLQRYLSDEPVSAGPPSAKYRLRKFVRRHRGGVVSGAMLTLALTIGTVATTVGMLRARRAETSARESATRARTEQQKAERTARFLRQMLLGAGPAVAQGRDATLLREILETTKSRLDGGELNDQPEVEATLRDSIGVVYSQMGDLRDAELMLERALLLRRAALGEEHRSYAESLHNLACVYLQQQRHDLAESSFKRVIELRERLVGADAPQTGASVNNLAIVYTETFRFDLAIAEYERALSILEKAGGPRSGDVGAVLSNLSRLHRWNEQFELAEQLGRRALDIRESALGPNRAEVATVLFNLGWALLEQGKLDEAESMLNRARDIQVRVLDDRHADVGDTLRLLADAYRERGRLEEAQETALRALDVVEQSGGGGKDSRGATLTVLGHIARDQNRLDDAAQYYRESLRAREREYGADSWILTSSLAPLGPV